MTKPCFCGFYATFDAQIDSCYLVLTKDKAMKTLLPKINNFTKFAPELGTTFLSM